MNIRGNTRVFDLGLYSPQLIHLSTEQFYLGICFFFFTRFYLHNFKQRKCYVKKEVGVSKVNCKSFPL